MAIFDYDFEDFRKKIPNFEDSAPKLRFLIEISTFRVIKVIFDQKYENFDFKIFCKFISCIGGAQMSGLLMMYEFMTNKILYLQFSK